MNDRAILECLIGTAVGDALGLPYEGISPRRAVKLLGPPTRFRFLFGRGMVSDDTEHTVLVAESLIESGGEAAFVEKAFARRLKRWFLLLPAGVGLATAKACFKLLIGISPRNSGVFCASMKSLQALSSQLQTTLEFGRRCQPVSPSWCFVLVRNVFFSSSFCFTGFVGYFHPIKDCQCISRSLKFSVVIPVGPRGKRAR
ncbi:MAG: ADP-ribosylglycohydrolase family protein [Planctomycetota bacterium]|nr:ADP-ribosylglycohydrolase family protein [Planctomycetota bacterium]